MKKLIVCSTILLGSMFLVTPSTHAQTGTSDKVMNELLNEVKQLRQDLRKMTASTYRAQTVFERLRLEQDQLNRATIEQGRVRVQLSSINGSRVVLTEKFADLDRKVQAGVISNTETSAIKLQLAELDQRQSELITRDTQLSAEIVSIQGRVEELNKRLDMIERDLLTMSGDKP